MEQKSKHHEYNLSFDNLAIPEVHISKTKSDDSETDNKPSVNYDSVAIPEIHVKKNKQIIK